MSTPNIVAYLNPTCPWSPGVEKLFNKYRLSYEFRNIVTDPEALNEMVQKSGQYSSPCVEVDGHMLADIGADELETWLLDRGLVVRSI